jgi:hypothetical protein
MHDFNCTNAGDMEFSLLAERTKYLKENPKGVSEMCKLMEDMRNEAEKKKAVDIASNLLLLGKLTYEEIVKCSGLKMDEVMELAGNK